MRFLLEGAESGSIGFSYVLPLKAGDGQLWGRVDADSPLRRAGRSTTSSPTCARVCGAC